ncbi:RNA polymerase sigma factor [Lampropedia aestuarii]|uniref:RNA polymerase sigma factor n=1 Tax=Lampropedia aestuarii TaxID=2562762 RepID=UPI001F0FA7CA|nr:RNA polymerase sigma factor [Lampropedia aestuarii]MDH5857355.1 RNA polymerase sigma factor [Lampropedia aestuarii]
MDERNILLRDLVVEHRSKLHRFIVKHIGMGTEAEELTQQAFVEACEAFETFRGQSEISTWLYGIAMNLVRNYLSRSPRRRFDFTDESELLEIAAENLGPDDQAEQVQSLQYLTEAMRDLPAHMREVLLMIAVDELSYEQASVLLCVPVGTVRSRLSRARVALREKLAIAGVELDF